MELFLNQISYTLGKNFGFSLRYNYLAMYTFYTNLTGKLEIPSSNRGLDIFSGKL